MAITTNNLISRQTVGSAGAASISFTNIPQTFTDLKIVVSARSTSAAAYDVFGLTLNTSGSGFTNISLYGNGSAGNVYSQADTTFTAGDVYGRVITAATPTSSQTASVFSSFELYIPNYTGGGKKTVSIDAVAETNDAISYSVGFDAALSPSVGAVTEMGFKLKDGSFVQYSTFSLYGISSNTSTQNTSVPSATGGDVITTDGTYWYHAFKASGTFTPLRALTADYLVVAGGGGGGRSGSGPQTSGGGGAGGLRSTNSSFNLGTTYTITIGAGSAGGQSGNTDATVGGTSSIAGTAMTTYSTTGGGGGVHWNTGGQNGGCGSGTGSTGYTGGTGNLGGFTPAEGTNGAGLVSGGGGGGAGAAATANAGGAGTNTYSTWASATVTGASGYYAGGGGGGGSGGTRGGGAGGGGAGATVSGSGTSGTANTGGGGGGNYNNSGVGGNGGSGIVIMRYLA